MFIVNKAKKRFLPIDNADLSKLVTTSNKICMIFGILQNSRKHAHTVYNSIGGKAGVTLILPHATIVVLAVCALSAEILAAKNFLIGDLFPWSS